MTLKELSIWINREFQEEKTSEVGPEQLINSMAASKLTDKHPQYSYEPREHHSHNVSQAQNRRLSKNNSVYMKRQVDQDQPGRE